MFELLMQSEIDQFHSLTVRTVVPDPLLFTIGVVEQGPTFDIVDAHHQMVRGKPVVFDAANLAIGGFGGVVDGFSLGF